MQSSLTATLAASLVLSVIELVDCCLSLGSNGCQSDSGGQGYLVIS